MKPVGEACAVAHACRRQIELEVRGVRVIVVFFFQAEDGIRDLIVTGVQTCALPISSTPSTRIRIPCPFPSSYVSRRIFENRPSVRSPRFFEASIWRPGRSWWTAYITTDRKSVV